jgi:hypothetical protein
VSVNGYKMEKNKILQIVNDAENKSNSDLLSTQEALLSEFEKTKSLIIELTYHLENVENGYVKISDEIKKRKGK